MEKTEFIFVLGHSDSPVRNRDIIPTGDGDVDINLYHFGKISGIAIYHAIYHPVGSPFRQEDDLAFG